MDWWVAAVALLVLHNVDGGQVLVNPQQIVALSPTVDKNLGTSNRLMAKGVQCVISLTNSKIISVIESCDAVAKAMENAR